jgi:hypothetical protein
MLVMRRLAYIAIVIFGLTAAACSGRDTTRDAGEAARSLVRVQLAYTRVTGLADVRFDAQARFVRYRAFDAASVPTILGMADYDSLALDGCKVSNGTAELDEALAPEAPAAEVALLDAGRLELHGPADRTALDPRRYPELVPFVTGVVYGGDEAVPLSLGLGQQYQVFGDGGVDVGGFVVSVNAPRAFPLLTIDPLRRGSDLDLHWTGDPSAVEPLLVEVKWSSRAGARGVRCRVRDSGSFSIPHGMFEALPSPASLQSATVTAIRYNRSPLAAPGAGRGDATLELREVAPLSVER